MERDREIAKLVNVLRRVARSASYASFNNVDPDASKFCAAQHNRLLARLSGLEPVVSQTFGSLADSSPPEIIRIAARELAVFFQDEAPPQTGRQRRHCGFGTVWADW